MAFTSPQVLAQTHGFSQQQPSAQDIERFCSNWGQLSGSEKKQYREQYERYCRDEPVFGQPVAPEPQTTIMQPAEPQQPSSGQQQPQEPQQPQQPATPEKPDPAGPEPQIRPTKPKPEPLRVDLVGRLELVGPLARSPGERQRLRVTVENPGPGGGPHAPAVNRLWARVFLSEREVSRQGASAGAFAFSGTQRGQPVRLPGVPAPGRTRDAMVEVPLPATLEEGNYWWCVQVDSRQAIEETEEGNNVACARKVVALGGESDSELSDLFGSKVAGLKEPSVQQDRQSSASMPDNPALDPFFSAVPASDEVKYLLASGVQHNYRLFDLSPGGPLAQATPIPWRGVIALPDPAENGTLIRWDLERSGWEPVSDDSAGPPSHVWYRNPDGSVAKKLLDDRGEFVGALTVGPGRRITITLDGDADRILDVVHSEWIDPGPRGGPRFRELLLANEHGPGLSMLEDLWRGRNPVCHGADSGMSATTGPASTEPGAANICSGAEDSRRSSGGGGTGIDVGSAESDEAGVGQRCERILEQGPPSPNTGFAGGGGSTGGDWAKPYMEYIESGFDQQEDSGGVQALRTVAGGWVLVGGAAWGGQIFDTVTSPPGAQLGEAVLTTNLGSDSSAAEEDDSAAGGASAPGDGEGYYDTDGDGELDAKDTDGDGEPDTSCERCGRTEDDSAEGGGKSMPGPDDGGTRGPSGSGYTQAEYEACARRAREQGLMEGDDPTDSPVTQECENPASDPRPYSGGTEGGAELDTYCGNRDDGNYADLAEMAGDSDDADECGAFAQPVDDGGCDDIGGWSSGGSKGTIGVAFGSVIGIDTCDPSICRRPGQ